MKQRQLTVGSLKKQTVPTPNKAEIKQILVPRKRELTEIQVMQNNKLFNVKPSKPNSTLLDLALQQNQSLSYKCKKGSCGKCTVQIVSGGSCLKKATQQEKKKLNEHLLSGYRLSCQAIVECD